jgi:ribosome-associated protein
MPETDKPSKTQRKKAMHELQAMGEALVDLSAHQLQAMALPADLMEAVVEARQMHSREGRRRQLQFIGRLMREVDPEPIRAQLAAWRNQSEAHSAQFHDIERWRARLLEDESALTEFAARYPGAELQPLRACVREARREQAAGVDHPERPARHFRQLFRLVREVVQAAAGPGADAQGDSEHD